MNIVVTGATKGIGKAIVYKYASEGFNVAFCSRSQEDLSNMEKDLSAKFPDIEVLSSPTDMSKKEQLTAFANLVNKEFGKCEVLVNNAGVFIPGTIHEEEEGMLEKQIETNLYSAYHFTRALIGNMITAKEGHIFNICSTASMKAYPNGGSYCISKFALLGFSKVLREEMKEHNVRVTSVLPGATLTASWEGVDLPPERFMKPEDIANVIWSAYKLSKQTVIEELTMRPILGDIE